jgi:hypothetical protein
VTLRRTGPPERRTPLNRGRGPKPRSDKRRGETDARQAAVEKAMRRSGGECVGKAIVPEVPCWGPMDVPRGVRPGGHLDGDNVQMLCRAHHDWKHAHPAEAHARGLRGWSWE